jgi:hypothetical protein
LQGLSLALHPFQRSALDPVARKSSFNSGQGMATVPALTTAVFVAEKQ